MEPFGGDKKNLTLELEQLQKDSLRIETESSASLQRILTLSDPEKDSEIIKKLSIRTHAIEPLLDTLKPLS